MWSRSLEEFYGIKAEVLMSFSGRSSVAFVHRLSNAYLDTIDDRNENIENRKSVLMRKLNGVRNLRLECLSFHESLLGQETNRLSKGCGTPLSACTERR